MKMKGTQISVFPILMLCIVFFMGSVLTVPAPLWGGESDGNTSSENMNRFPIMKHGFAGTFLIKETGDSSNWRIITLTADGNWFSTASNQTSIGLDPDMGYGDQQGVWIVTGWRKIAARVLNFDYAVADGSHIGNAVADYEVTFSHDFNSLTGEYKGKEYPADQNPLNPDNPDDYVPFGATFEGTRLKAVP